MYLPANDAAPLPDAKGLTLFLAEESLTTQPPTADEPLNRSITTALPATHPTACSTAPPNLCPTDWGSWSPTSKFTFLSGDSFQYKEATLSLWLRPSETILLRSFTAQLHKGTPTTTCGGGALTCIYQWKFDSSNLEFEYEDPGTGLPALRLEKNVSYPFTLFSPIRLGGVVTIKPTDVLTLRFLALEAVASNQTDFQLHVEYGSPQTPSAISGFLTAASTYATADVLGLFIEDGDKLSYTAPTIGAYKERVLPWDLDATPITVGRVEADQDYTFTGNALVRLYFVVMPTNTIPESGTQQKVRQGPQLQFKVEVRLVVDDQLISSNFGEFRTGGLFGQPFVYDAPVVLNGFKPTPVASPYGLPTAGLTLPKGTSIELQVNLTGWSDPLVSRFILAYGSIKEPSGLQIPVKPATKPNVGCPTPTTPPPKHTLSAAAGSAQARLGWINAEPQPCQGILYHRVYRSTSATDVPVLAATLEGEESYLDFPLSNGITYYYQVAAVNAAGESVLSNQVAITPTSTAPNFGNFPGTTNGNHSLYADHRNARIAAGSSGGFRLTLENRAPARLPFEVYVDGLPEPNRVFADPPNGTLEPDSLEDVRLTILVSLTETDLASYPLNVTVYIGDTEVGPLELVVWVEPADSTPGGPIDSAEDPQPSSPGKAVRVRPAGRKSISQGQATPGFEAAILLAGLAIILIAIRQRAQP